MKYEFFLDLIFIAEETPEKEALRETVEKQMVALFSGKGQWQVEQKQDGNLAIILIEIKGMWSWMSEEMVIAFLEKEASLQFWELLQGFQIRLDEKEYVECSHCGNR